MSGTRTSILALGGIVLFLTAVHIIGQSSGSAIAAGAGDSAAGGNMSKLSVTLGTTTILAVVADTDPLRAKGLLGWSVIGEGTGMLLDFIRPGKYAIHMEGMKFPIDGVWIDDKGEIKLIYEGIMPNQGLNYPSLFPCRYCLELKAGFCKKYGVKMGERVVFGRSSPSDK
ncbi:DUF192 domain-containing protein [Thermodesulfobacteriota bacterium]